MKCPNCGGELNDAAVCMECGHYDAGAAEHVSVIRPASDDNKPADVKMYTLHVSRKELEKIHALICQDPHVDLYNTILADKTALLLESGS